MSVRIADRVGGQYKADRSSGEEKPANCVCLRKDGRVRAKPPTADGNQNM